MQHASIARSWRGAAPAVWLTLLFVFVAVLEVAVPSRYAQSILTAWGVIPFRFPFVDAEAVLSSLRCLREGVDVLATNPCDPLQRVFDYSPLWLTLAVFPVTTDWIAPVGVAMDVAFLASLLLLPPGRGWRATGLVLLAASATSVAFAMERANIDVIVFTLASVAAWLACRSSAWRLVGYGCALLAGLLKYYPMLVLALVSRERPARFFAIAAACALALALFVVFDGRDLVRALALIPVGSYFGDMFGASTLAEGLASHSGAAAWVGRVGAVGLSLLCIGAAVVIGTRREIGVDLARLTPQEQSFLLAGAMLVLACFFTAQNIGYRATMLLMTVPSLTSLWLSSGRRLYLWTVVLAILAMWAPGWRHWLDAGLQGLPPWAGLNRIEAAGPRFGGWLLREFCWWWVVTVLASLAAGLLWRSTVVSALWPARVSPPQALRVPIDHPLPPTRAR